jgi:hypothetical protein
MSLSPSPMNVFLTVDTEVWPRYPDWRETELVRDIERDIQGITPEGDFGVPYQIRVLNEHELKAAFFVESLCASAAGPAPLRGVVEQIQSQGQEVQLHVHTEWLAWMTDSLLPGRTGQSLKDFSLGEQSLLIRQAAENLRTCGARNVCAFRAGNYGANFDTLRALAREGVAIDTSYNAYYLDSQCGLRLPELLVQPRQIEGVWEFPISCFRDWPGHVRHAQLCACTAREIEQALLSAWRAGWGSFVIVSHGFELIRRRKQIALPPLPDHFVRRRFERLCRFLAEHRDKFRTRHFGEIDEQSLQASVQAARPLRSGMHRTAHRYVEQLVRRMV